MEKTQKRTPKIQELAASLADLKIKEVQELLDCLKVDYGIEPAAVAAPQVAAPNQSEVQEEKEEKTIFNIMLKSFVEEKKINVIKAVRKITGQDLKKSKALVYDAPSMIKENVAKAEAEAIKKELEEAGGKVELK